MSISKLSIPTSAILTIILSGVCWWQMDGHPQADLLSCLATAKFSQLHFNSFTHIVSRNFHWKIQYHVSLWWETNCNYVNNYHDLVVGHHWWAFKKKIERNKKKTSSPNILQRNLYSRPLPGIQTLKGRFSKSYENIYWTSKFTANRLH